MLSHLDIKYCACLNHSLWHYHRSYKRIAKPTAAVDKTMGKNCNKGNQKHLMTRKYPFSCTNLAIRLLLPHCNKCLQCAFGIQIVQHNWLGSSKLGMLIIYSKFIAANRDQPGQFSMAKMALPIYFLQNKTQKNGVQDRLRAQIRKNRCRLGVSLFLPTDDFRGQPIKI